jgi:two-component system phosphate regulon sensor histidine kinase PhoR
MIDPLWIILAAALAILFFALWRIESAAHHASEREVYRLKRAIEAQLEQHSASVNALVAAVESSETMLLAVDREMRVLAANPSAKTAFGDLYEQPSLITYTQSLQLEQIVRDTFELREEGSLTRVLNLDNRPHRVISRLVENVVGLSISDVAEIQRLSRARQDMVANLSHELRTPITSLRLLADTLRGPAVHEKEVMDGLLQKISAEVDTLEQMAQEMLDLSAIESGQQIVRLIPERLRELLYAPLARIEEQAKRREVELTVNVPDELLVLIDRDQASRAVLNVLHNAVKFTAGGSEVQIEAWFDEDVNEVILSISDQGPGVHPEDIERIFERFFRGDRARVAPGTGLGLAIVRHIMRAHGGRVWVENRQPPDTGATFYLAFQAA